MQFGQAFHLDEQGDGTGHKRGCASRRGDGGVVDDVKKYLDAACADCGEDEGRLVRHGDGAGEFKYRAIEVERALHVADEEVGGLFCELHCVAPVWLGSETAAGSSAG